jgi:hypothetical protein
MTEDIVETQLDDRAFSYVEERLSHGYALAEALASRSDLRAGSVRTYLPSDVPEDRRYDFKSVVLDEGPGVPDPQRGGRWVRARNLRHVLSPIVTRHLSNTVNICVLEEYILSPDQTTRSPEPRCLIMGDAVFHLLTSRDSEAQVLKTLNVAQSWLFIGALSSSVESLDLTVSQQAIDSTAIDEIATKATAFLVGAYDGNGFLIWSAPGK